MPSPTVTDPLDASLELFRCPRCHAALGWDGPSRAELACANAHRFDVWEGRLPDLAGDVSQPDTPGQWAMQFAPLAAIYERVWRPAFTAAAGGTNPEAERRQLLGWLDLPADGTLLDVACGPGNTTRALHRGWPGGRIVAADLSEAMLRRALIDTPATAPITYVRADAHTLPVNDACFDGAHVAAALYLVDDPGAVVAEMARALKPGGRFVGMTIIGVAELTGLPYSAVDAVVRRFGMHHFGRAELAHHCEAAGLVDLETTRTGASLLFRAAKAPA